MLSLDEDEVRVVMVALRRISAELNRQIEGGPLQDCGGAARYVCKYYGKPKTDALIARIEQWQQDEKAGVNDASTS